ncbi:MAG: DUF4339 domain-containing protein [Planctomycetota bacterium]|nr:DUF4339 domain-containing protein [Planctomycetota bacterium]
MGIKFHCPNGHKLNVKSFLAGKRGICPKCHVRMRIPMESESEVGTEVVASVSPKKVRAQAAGNRSTEGGTAVLDREIQTLLDDPERTWHMTAADDAQFGPATGVELLDWLAEGRISLESHVWCDSWEDWRAAGDVFPQLTGEQVEQVEEFSNHETAPTDDPFSNINPAYLDNITADSVISPANDNPFSTLIKPDPESSRVAGSRRSKSEKKPSRGKAILLGLVALASLVLLVVIFINMTGGE